MLAEERMHRTIKRLVINNKKDKLSAIGVNYDDFQTIETDWALSANRYVCRDVARTFANPSTLQYADQNIDLGPALKGYVELDDDLLDQVMVLWRVRLKKRDYLNIVQQMADEDEKKKARRVTELTKVFLDGQLIKPVKFHKKGICSLFDACMHFIRCNNYILFGVIYTPNSMHRFPT